MNNEDKTYQERQSAIDVLKQVSKLLSRDYISRKCYCKVCTQIASSDYELSEPCNTDYEWHLKDKIIEDAIKLVEEYYF